jgi:hypothetical protein
VETDAQTGTEPEPRTPLKYRALGLLIAGTALRTEAAQGVARAMHIAAWRRQRLLKRKLGLQILFKSEHPVAFGEFEALRGAADRLGGVDPSRGPWLFYRLDPQRRDSGA